MNELMERLREPFPKEAIGWKPGKVVGNRCLAMAYIDARDVMNRLDEVVGPEAWQDDYTFLPDGSVVCRLSLLLGGEWVTKQDVGSESEQPDPGDRHKAAVSDALKRAAVKWGIGRYLYALDSSWADYDPQKKQITTPPNLPPWALPKARTSKPAAPPPPPADDKLRKQSLELLEKVALQGLDALQTTYRTLSRNAQLAIQGPDWDAIKRAAQTVDERRKEANGAAVAH